MGLPHIHLRERGWGVPIRTRGQTLWLSRYMCTSKSAKHILQKIRKTLKSVRAIFNVFSRYRSIPGEHMKNREMTNSIAGEYIPESIKIKNVYSRYRLDSG
jgi:hypothetical protein